MTVPNVGILLPTRALLLQPGSPRDLEPILSLAEFVEQAGYGSVWVGDSLLASPRPEAVVTLSAIAARTTRIRIGSAILIGSLRHPVHMAHQLATVDLVAGGRLVVGMGYSSGTGIWKDEHELVGVRADDRHARTRESIEAMRTLWRETSATHRGRFYDFEDVRLEPSSPQAGGPPIWLHGMRGERTLRRVAEYGDGWITNLATVEEFSNGWAKVRAHVDDLGRDADRFEACHYSTVRVAADGAAAHASGRAFMQAYYGGMDPDEIERIECCRYGTPEQVLEQLSRFVEAGATSLILRIASENQGEQIDQLTKRVLPGLA